MSSGTSLGGVSRPVDSLGRGGETSAIGLIGRTPECAAIGARLDQARRGISGALVLRGEGGIGKTSLLEFAVGAAEGMTVQRVIGVEVEQGLSFSAVHRLLVPLLASIDDLPAPQQGALETALGRAQSEPPDRFLIGLAILTLFARAAEARPLLVVVDDVQWIDGESADLLAFVARRLYAEGVVMLFALREPIGSRDPFAGLPSLDITGLDSADASRLLDSASAIRLDATTVDRIVAETQGNPLALVEVGREVHQDGLAVLLPNEPLPLSTLLEARFRQQMELLPEPTRHYLLIAAAEPTRPALVYQTARRLGLPADVADPAIAARLLDPRRDPLFRHPLIRSAVYGGAAPSERRQVHAMLAELTDPADVECRAWHMAGATSGPDEATASELERGGARAHSRGGWAARSAFLARAAELTPVGQRRVERLLAAAEAALVAGARGRAQRFLGEARHELTEKADAAKAGRIDAAMESFTIPGRVPAILLESATALQLTAPIEARDTFAEALQACLVSCQLTADTTPEHVAKAALSAFELPAEPDIADLMLHGFATRFAVGYVEAVPALRRSVTALCGEDAPSDGLTRWAILGNNAAADLWDCDKYRRMLTKLENVERRRGGLDSLRITLGGLGHCRMWSGEFAAAEVAHSEATQISIALGDGAASWEALKVELFAWQGRSEETRFIARLLAGEGTASAGAGVVVNLGRIALVILNIAEGHYEDALGPAMALFADDACPHGSQVLPELVEAASRSGDLLTARRAFDRLRERAETSGTSWALGLLARSEALLVTDDPEPHFVRALELLGQTYVKTDLARAHLLYGEWLRREKRRIEAREQLRVAYELFDTMGARAFVERARIELAATGEKARSRRHDTTVDLTPQERQIAQMASTGATNREIASQLFLSSGTIDYHLRKVFQKLQVSSRRQLHSALALAPS
jgi:DNA-binding CsgD family transcriptional regulator